MERPSSAAGFEYTYDHPNFYTGNRNTQNPPFAPNVQQTQGSNTGPISLTNPWSTGLVQGSPYPAPYPPTATSAKFYGQSQWVALPSDFHPPQTLQYTASMQHSFPHDWQMQLDYIGSKTNRLPLGVPLNPIDFIPGVWGANGTGCAGVVLTGPAAAKPGAAGTPCSTTANTVSRASLVQINPVQGTSTPAAAAAPAPGRSLTKPGPTTTAS